VHDLIALSLQEVEIFDCLNAAIIQARVRRWSPIRPRRTKRPHVEHATTTAFEILLDALGERPGVLRLQLGKRWIQYASRSLNCCRSWYSASSKRSMVASGWQSTAKEET
jgi:hypothetical protein